MLTVSVIIPVKPGFVPQALRRLALVDWPPDQLELLVAQGTNPSRQRNAAAKQAKGEIIYFLDDDSLVAADQLQRLENHFRDNQVVAVGGPSLTPVTDNLLQQAIGAALSSRLGAGGVCNRYRAVGTVRETTERELILCNLAFRRETFLSAGGLDERLYPNEENELLDRLLEAGGRLLHDPQLAVERSQRSSLAAFVKQMFRYGRGRAQQTRIAGFQGVMPFAPLCFILYLLILPFSRQPFGSLPLVIYLLSVCFASMQGAIRQRSPLLLLLLPLLFPLLHISNGSGLLIGFLFPIQRQTCYNQSPITVQSLQPFEDPANPGVIRWI